MPLVIGFLMLVGLQLLGDFISELFNLPIPGAIIGMVLLLVILVFRKAKDVPSDIAVTADGLIKYIGLLFVPAGAGVSLYLGLIADQWVMILTASFLSTAFTLIFCALIYKALSKDKDVEESE